MPFRQLTVVTIEFAGAGPFAGGALPGGELATGNIRLVESRTGPSRTFILHDGTRPEYALSAAETAQLDHLLAQVAVKVPWEGRAGFDGADYELTLRGAMSSLTFRWWIEPPAEWQQVGAVVDFVLAVADGRGARDARHP